MAHPASFVVGIDQNLCGTSAYLLDADGDFVPLCAFEHRQFYPQAGWVEHDPLELLSHVSQCLERGIGAEGAGVANQGETVVAWNADTGEPLYNAIVWQDTRTAPVIERLRAEGAEALTLAKAGLPLDSYYAASKLRWFIDHVPEAKALARRGRLRLGTTDSFFLDRLCGVHATDIATASRTGLMNLATGQWDNELCRLFGVPRDSLPAIRATTGEFGITSPSGIPWVASLSDRQAALFGHGCHRAGEAKITFGAGAYAVAVSGDAPPVPPGGGMLPTVAWMIDDKPVYAIDAGVHNAESALNWARRLGLYVAYQELDHFDGATALERGLVFVPALSGLACPYWDRSAAGLWIGMDLATDSRDLLRAVLEGIAMRCAQALAAMADSIPLAETVSIDGGLSRSRYFCAFLARALARTVVAPSSADLTALGCAQLAFVGAGLGTLDSLPARGAPRVRITPEAPLPSHWHERYADAVQRARGWREAA